MIFSVLKMFIVANGTTVSFTIALNCDTRKTTCETKRFYNKKRKKIGASHPHIVNCYNECMDGAELLDCLIGSHRLMFCSKK